MYRNLKDVLNKVEKQAAQKLLHQIIKVKENKITMKSNQFNSAKLSTMFLPILSKTKLKEIHIIQTSQIKTHKKMIKLKPYKIFRN